MTEPTWIEVEDVLAIHDLMLAQYGGIAGVRDQGLLDSALHKPKHLLAYGAPTLHDLAAAYAAGIVQNHPFSDGNKRTGFMCAATFLEINGYTLTASEIDVVTNTVALADHSTTETEYARFLKANCELVS